MKHLIRDKLNGATARLQALAVADKLLSQPHAIINRRPNLVLGLFARVK